MASLWFKPWLKFRLHFKGFDFFYAVLDFENSDVIIFVFSSKILDRNLFYYPDKVDTPVAKTLALENENNFTQKII